MNWLFKSPLYFNVCFVFGLLFWVLFGFDFSTQQLRMIAGEDLPIKMSPTFSKDPYEQTISDEKKILNSISDQELEALLIGDERSQAEVERQLRYQNSFLNSFEDSYADLLVDEEGNKLVTSTANTIDYEEAKSCRANRLDVEKVFDTNKSEIEEYLTEREDPSPESSTIPRSCVTHIMNKFNLGSFNFARCRGSDGEPARGGVKPCVTKNLVNYTYNALVDVSECLNINTKSLLPKLSNESGLIINTLGVGFDAGIGQLTSDAIAEVNKFYDIYLTEVRRAADAGKASCQRIVSFEKEYNEKSQKKYARKFPGKKFNQNFSLLAKVGNGLSNRCGLIAPPENPMRNILYMGIYNRLNMDYLSGVKFRAGIDYLNDKPIKNDASDTIGGAFERNGIKKLLKEAGLSEIEKVNFHRVVEMVTLAGYNAGPTTAFKMLLDYLNRRIAYNKLPGVKKRYLTDADFDFHNPKKQKDDVDGIERTVVENARLNVNSPMIVKNEKNLKVRLDRVRSLPEKIRTAHLRTFPEFMIYRQNNFESSILNPINLAKVNDVKDVEAKALLRSTFPPYKTNAAPGYLSFLAAKDNALRLTFLTAGQSEWLCSDKNFLKLKQK
jgi:hypothetical protein